MKQVLITLAACLILSLNVYPQCTPTGGGNPGVTPAPDNVTCIERGVPYSITMQLVNFTTIQGLVTVNWARIDSLVNFPCGITWQANKLQFAGGEAGCITVSGTTTDAIGQYPLGIYMTVNLTAFGQTLEQGGEISGLIDQLENTLGVNLGVDLSYYSRVIDPGNSCPAIDRSGSANNLTSSGATCQSVSLSVTVSGNNTICSGDSTTLTATTSNSSGTVAYSWSSGQTAQSITVSPTSSVNYSVTVTDQNGSATASRNVTVNQLPTSSFTYTVQGLTATFTNTSTGATSYLWEFGTGGGTSTLQNPTHTFPSAGSYDIRLTATNSCGSTEDTEPDIQITPTGINTISDGTVEVSPNPSSGIFEIKLQNINSENLLLNILDLSGRNIYSEVMQSNVHDINLSSLSKGVYVLNLSNSYETVRKKLVIY